MLGRPSRKPSILKDGLTSLSEQMLSRLSALQTTRQRQPSQTPVRYGYDSKRGGINARNVHRPSRHSLPADQDPHRTMPKVCVSLLRHSAVSEKDASTVIGINLLADVVNDVNLKNLVYIVATKP